MTFNQLTFSQMPLPIDMGSNSAEDLKLQYLNGGAYPLTPPLDQTTRNNSNPFATVQRFSVSSTIQKISSTPLTQPRRRATTQTPNSTFLSTMKIY
jgi:hypothetical protein